MMRNAEKTNMKADTYTTLKSYHYVSFRAREGGLAKVAFKTPLLSAKSLDLSDRRVDRGPLSPLFVLQGGG